MSLKDLVLELNAKILSPNLTNYWRYKVDFLDIGTCLLRLQIDDVILHESGQANFKNLRSQKLKEL